MTDKIETPVGLFTGGDVSLNIVNTGKDFTSIVDPTGQMAAQSITSFFNIGMQDAIGKCTLSKGGITMDCRCSFRNNILSISHHTGARMFFCFQFGMLYSLDPDGAVLVILKKQ